MVRSFVLFMTNNCIVYTKLTHTCAAAGDTVARSANMTKLKLLARTSSPACPFYNFICNPASVENVICDVPDALHTHAQHKLKKIQWKLI